MEDYSNYLLALLGGGLLTTIITIFYSRKNRTADAYVKLSNTVSNLSTDLEEEIANRRSDRILFAEELQKQKKQHQAEIEELHSDYAESMTEFENALVRIKQVHQKGIEQIKRDHAKSLAQIKRDHAKSLAKLEGRVTDLESERDKLIFENHELRKIIESLKGDANDN